MDKNPEDLYMNESTAQQKGAARDRRWASYGVLELEVYSWYPHSVAPPIQQRQGDEGSPIPRFVWLVQEQLGAEGEPRARATRCKPGRQRRAPRGRNALPGASWITHREVNGKSLLLTAILAPRPLASASSGGEPTNRQSPLHSEALAKEQLLEEVSMVKSEVPLSVGP
ncbi:hypothetical protein BOTBODRAFT_44006 [Botryobasidium botryosum FD-172 SS1]|uniref:Uncharacterized protein n=1 Tax=Botryobasidium botryosum (strain FD-172 SS1) TaxID=930990 RepID=A0A067MV42_BOTB1|nr:hypothetical protein BOTBODRAFT_44006 [Botryobasidium botryosum FD-172 SS1]